MVSPNAAGNGMNVKRKPDRALEAGLPKAPGEQPNHQREHEAGIHSGCRAPHRGREQGRPSVIFSNLVRALD